MFSNQELLKKNYDGKQVLARLLNSGKTSSVIITV